MSWLILVLSGALEAVWAAALHRIAREQGMQRLVPALVFLVSAATSMGGLAVAMQSVPTGTAYAVWVGVGVVLTSGYAIVSGVERPTATRILLLCGIAACVAGLKVVA